MSIEDLGSTKHALGASEVLAHAILLSVGIVFITF